VSSKRLLSLCAAIVAVLAATWSASAVTNVAVFNFQMTSDTPDWRWLEKGLADRITTDFTQDRSLSVVARDEMQLLAQKMNWVPEMATSDPRRMKDIRRRLRITQLVTGVYSVTGEEIRITGQIVDVESRSEVARKEVAGKATDVLDLQRRLSAELLSWFSKKPAEEILERLPVWTRSLPAAKALYEGMDLYDQGRYAEGWLKFRQASREDPDYVEALYWVGKMYYFMDRYEHARRTIERFVYLDITHPRLGDAMVEYVHTYESTGAPAEALLRLYDDLARRYPGASMWEGQGPYGRFDRIDCEDWVRYKSAQLLGQAGRSREAVLLTAPATHDAESGGIEGPVCLLQVLDHHARTAEQFEPEVLGEVQWERVRRSMIRFTPDGREAVLDLPQQTRVLGKEMKDLDRTAAFDKEETTFSMYLLAPSGHVFKSLRFYPSASGDDAVFEVSLRLLGIYIDIAPPRSESLTAARRAGLACDPAPRTGILIARCTLRAAGPKSGPAVISGVRIVPTLEKVPAPGAIDVWCAETAYFRVEVDGAFARWFPGLVGPLAPGEHTVRVYPAEADSPLGECTARVSVSAGGVTQAVLNLPWKPDGGWAGWTHVRVPQEYPGFELKLNHTPGAPAVLADEEGLHLVWSRGGDLWAATSTDGKEFTKPRKLDMPVSSGWVEKDPRLMRHPSGRFVLTFLSDRNAQHRMLAYLTWSRDFLHWSAPAAISDRYVPNTYAVCTDDRGRTLWAEPDKNVLRIFATSDGVRWEELAQVRSAEPKGRLWAPHLLQRPDGQYELLVESGRAYMVTEEPDPNDWHGYVRHLSGDGKVWSAPQRLWDLPKVGYKWLAAARGEKGAVLLGAEFASHKNAARTMLMAEQPDGSWKASGYFRGVTPGGAAMAYHPKWGYVITHMMPEGGSWNPHPSYGPFVMRGRALDDVLAAPGVEIQPDPRMKIRTGPTLATTSIGADGRVTERTVEGKEKAEAKGSPAPAPPPRTGVGELTYGTQRELEGLGGCTIDLVGAEHFRKPAPGAGTVSPRSLVAMAQQPPLRLAIALDSTKPDAQHYDVVRLDFTGQANFANAYILPQQMMRYSPTKKEFCYQFVDRGLKVKLGERAYTIVAFVIYWESENRREIYARLYTSAEGVCRFGPKEHNVRLCDTTSNLRVDDVPKTIFQDASHKAQEGGDAFFVDTGDGTFKSYACGLYGSPVLVDGGLWNLRVSKDGGEVTAEPYAGPTGRVRINHPAWQARVVGQATALWIYGGPESVPVPAGRFVLVDYVEWLTPDASTPRTRLKVGCTREGNRGIDEFVVRPAATTDIAIGSPVTLGVVAAKQGEVVRFDYHVYDVTGRRPAYPEGERQQTPDWDSICINVSDAGGRPVARCHLTGGSTGWHMEWKPPPETRGRFTATLSFHTFGFPAQPRPATFEIK